MSHAKAPPLKRSSAVFLQGVVVLVGFGALALLLWEPQVEGVNAHATFSQIYFHDPFLAYLYVGSIPFFVAVVQAFRILGFVRKNSVFSPAAVRSSRTIKFCAITIIAFVAGAEVVILLHESDDRAGGVFMGVLITVGSVIVATTAATFEWILAKAVEIKSENDLTV